MAQYFTYQDTTISSGDTVRVSQQISEGGKTRTQHFEGIVIAIKNAGNGRSFTVRRIGANGVGVEKIFPVKLPSIANIKVTRQAHVRRAKLYYLRSRVGKAATTLRGKQNTTASK